jgi:methylenetetrahydrofolate reductase (NADPH)
MSRLEAKLRAGEFVVTAELPTVDGGGLDAVRQRVEPFADYVDAVNATDNTGARAHASSVALAIALERLDVEPIMQLVCRDRNRLALEAAIVGASLHGIENILCLGGDPMKVGDEPEAKAVNDLDTLGLLAAARGIADGAYLSGRELAAPALFVGAAETPAPPVDDRVARVLDKVHAGAEFFQLQVSFDPADLDRFLQAAGSDAFFIPSITIVRSARTLRFMDEKVPGISVPAAAIEKVEQSKDEEQACLDLAADVVARTLEVPGVAGLHLIGFGRADGVAELCRRVGIPTRLERETLGYRPALAV